MSPPMVFDVIIPNNQRTIRIIAIVFNIECIYWESLSNFMAASEVEIVLPINSNLIIPTATTQ